MIRSILRICLFVLGMNVVGIGVSMILLGPSATGNFFAKIISWFFSDSQNLNGFSSTNIDSELRFYAVFFVAYGAALLGTATNLARYMKFVPLLAGLFLIGGIGRMLSFFLVGPPHILFSVLMAIELALPLLIIFLWQFARERDPAATVP
ncbi:MAG: DUF4345 domain-containing protein [Rhizobiaceae bacterium]|nr:DUF4345 domain-containing protein [Rhizobiaceae bacterium]